MQTLYVRGKSRPPLQLAPAPFATGTYNTVSEAHGWSSPVIVRKTQEGMAEDANDVQTEEALMKLMSLKRIHPVLHAITHKLIISEGSPPMATSMSVMQKGESLDNWLREGGEHDDADGRRLAESLVKKLCLVSDMGYCMTDLKPGNVVVIGKGVKLIDFSPTFTIFMDRSLFLNMSYSHGRSIKHEELCSRTRGMSLYLMILLFYLFLKYGPSEYKRNSRFEGFISVLHTKLIFSCVPVEALLLNGGALKDALSKIVYHYIFSILRQEDVSDDSLVSQGISRALKDLVKIIKNDRLTQTGCEGQVFVNGIDYTSPVASCVGERKWSIVSSVDNKPYPCPIAENIMQYKIQGPNVTQDSKPIKVPRVSSRSRSR